MRPAPPPAGLQVPTGTALHAVLLHCLLSGLPTSLLRTQSLQLPAGSCWPQGTNLCQGPPSAAWLLGPGPSCLPASLRRHIGLLGVDGIGLYPIVRPSRGQVLTGSFPEFQILGRDFCWVQAARVMGLRGLMFVPTTSCSLSCPKDMHHVG